MIRMSSFRKKSYFWLCDGKGDIYFAENIVPEGDEESGIWRNVGEGFDSVAAGHSGLVCAIKKGSLYLRTGVTYRQPAGTGWEDCACGALAALVGTRCIVRQASVGGAWYFTRGLMDLVKGLFDWKAIGLQVDNSFSSDNPAFYHHTIDSQDILYAFTETDQVACCNLSTTEQQWSIVANSIPSSSVSKVLRFVTRRAMSSPIHSTAAGTNNSIWCFANKGKEIWQLVVSKLNSRTMYTWNKHILPANKKVEVQMFEASKLSRGVLYFILKQGRRYRLSLLSLGNESSEFVDIVYPSSYWTCRAMATACLPAIVEEKLCCEDGSCSSCRSLKRSLGDKEEFDNETKFRTCFERPPSPKRCRVELQKSLVHEIGVKCKSMIGLLEKFQPDNIISQANTTVNLDEFEYNFSLEHHVLSKYYND